MTVRPILFSGPMVRALLEGRKTQTRRGLYVNGKFTNGGKRMDGIRADGSRFQYEPPRVTIGTNEQWNLSPWRNCKAGDLLWVRETWSHSGHGVWSIADAQISGNGAPIYAADGTHDAGCKFWPSIHMPRRFSRLTLEVKDMRIQRLHDISEEDAAAEGVESDSDGWFDYLMPSTQCCRSARDSMRTLWDSINTPRGFGWDANPWVVAVSFRIFPANIDQIIAARQHIENIEA